MSIPKTASIEHFQCLNYVNATVPIEGYAKFFQQGLLHRHLSRLPSGYVFHQNLMHPVVLHRYREISEARLLKGYLHRVLSGLALCFDQTTKHIFLSAYL
jgi:hypothetical protein